MCNFNFNRICQNISRAAGVVSPATLSGPRQPQNSRASHPQPPCTHASTDWQRLDGSSLGSGGFRFTSVSSFLGPGFRARGCLGMLFSGILTGDTEGREGLFNLPVTPARVPWQEDTHNQVQHQLGAEHSGSRQQHGGAVLVGQGGEDRVCPLRCPLMCQISPLQ